MDSEFPLTEYQKQESNLPSQVAAIRTILLEEHGLSIPIHCDAFICRCIRLKDGNTENAVKLIKAFHTLTVNLDYWETPLVPSFFENFYKLGTLFPLIKRDPQGHRIYVFRSAKWNPQELKFDELIGGVFLLAQYINAEFIDVQRKGYVAILDLANFTLEQAWAVKHMKLIAAVRVIQNGIIGRIKAVHVINHSQLIRVIYAAIRPFLKEKLKKRLNFHANFESLHKQISPECLPNYLGGQFEGDEGIDTAMIEDLISKDEFFKDYVQNGFQDK